MESKDPCKFLIEISIGDLQGFFSGEAASFAQYIRKENMVERLENGYTEALGSVDALLYDALALKAFIKLEWLMSKDEWQKYLAEREVAVVQQVMVDQILSAPLIGSWQEALKASPGDHLPKILSGEIDISGNPPSLVRYGGIYIATGYGWKVAVHKGLGNKEILANVLETK